MRKPKIITRLALILIVGIYASVSAQAALFDSEKEKVVPRGKVPEKPNIVLILVDDLGWFDVGYHGSEIKTPNIDTLAREGIRYEQFYTQHVCTQTRSSLLTGRYPIRQGLQVDVIKPWATYGLPLEERTLADALKEAGYYTAIVGKWHLGAHSEEYLPLARGFDYQYGPFGGSVGYWTHRRAGQKDWQRNQVRLRQEGYATELIMQEAVRVVNNHDGKKPLFLYLPFTAPHSPLQAPDEYIEKYKDIKPENRRIYSAMVDALDDSIGRIVFALDKRGMRENTLILFASDNGGSRHAGGAQNGELRGQKGALYDGAVRVPAIAYWPGVLQPNINNELMHIVDWYPTLLRIGGASTKQPLPLDGMDVWDTMAYGEPSPRTEILHNVEPDRGAIRQGDWKLVKNDEIQRDGWVHKARLELFNIALDPNEKEDLSNAYPNIVEKLMARLEEYRAESLPPKGSRDNRPKNLDEVKARVKASKEQE